MRTVIVILTTLMTFSSTYAQQVVDVRFNPSSITSNKSCLDLEIRSVSQRSFSLAGQNYRIYYNPNKLQFLTDELKSYNSTKAYADIKLLKNHYSKELSTAMINLGVDAIEYDQTNLTKIQNDTWTKVSNVCFTHKAEIDFELIWARQEKTGELATAFVSLSEWASEKEQKNIEIQEYIDYSQSEDIYSEFTPQINVYPNPVVNEINVTFDNNSITGEIRVVDLTGKEVTNQQITKHSIKISLNVEDLSSGKYFLEVLNHDNKQLFKSSFVKTTL